MCLYYSDSLDWVIDFTSHLTLIGISLSDERDENSTHPTSDLTCKSHGRVYFLRPGLLLQAKEL